MSDTKKASESFNPTYLAKLLAVAKIEGMTTEKATEILSTKRGKRGKPSNEESLLRDCARAVLGLGKNDNLLPKAGTSPKKVMVRGPITIPAGEVQWVEVYVPPTVNNSEKAETPATEITAEQTETAPAVETAEAPATSEAELSAFLAASGIDSPTQ